MLAEAWASRLAGIVNRRGDGRDAGAHYVLDSACRAALNWPCDDAGRLIAISLRTEEQDGYSTGPRSGVTAALTRSARQWRSRRTKDIPTLAGTRNGCCATTRRARGRAASAARAPDFRTPPPDRPGPPMDQIPQLGVA